MIGWYAVKRGTIKHELFAPTGKWSKFEAWSWMVESAAYKPTVIDIGGKPYTVPRGALCFSRRFLAAKLMWSEKSVMTFLLQLERHEAIQISVAKTGTGTRAKRTQVTLCNYDKYQSTGTKTEPKGDQKGTKEEQVNNNSLREAEKSASVKTPSAIIFDQGLAILMDGGLKEIPARKMLGKWRNDHTDEKLIAALSRAQREQPVDPIAFIQGCFKFAAKRAQPQYGDKRINPQGVHQEYDGVGGWIKDHHAQEAAANGK